MTSSNATARSATTLPTSSYYSHAVYWSDGSVLSEDPTHFATVSTADHYLYTKDGRPVHVNRNPIPEADPSTFEVLPPDKAVTNCSETSIPFAE